MKIIMSFFAIVMFVVLSAGVSADQCTDACDAQAYQNNANWCAGIRNDQQHGMCAQAVAATHEQCISDCADTNPVSGASCNWENPVASGNTVTYTPTSDPVCADSYKVVTTTYQ